MVRIPSGATKPEKSAARRNRAPIIRDDQIVLNMQVQRLKAFVVIGSDFNYKKTIIGFVTQ
jgi:hypothetical protein